MTVFNRFNSADPATQFESVDIHEDRFAQGAEINEIQSILRAARKRSLDALFDEGDIISGCQLAVDPATGAATAADGSMYIDGDVRVIAPATLTVPTAGAAVVGAYLTRATVTHMDDPGLRGPDPALPGGNEPGADRTRATLTWGQPGDGQPGDFFPVWDIIDGVVKAKEPAPQLAAVTRALENYDRQSTGGYYIVEGLTLTQLDDVDTDTQAYMLAPGSARVNGILVQYPIQRRIELATQRPLATVNGEPTLVTTDTDQPIAFARPPLVGTPQILITARKTVTLTHGIAGAADALPDASVLVVESVTQGATTYDIGTDCVLTAGQLDWSPPGAEPAPGSSYQATYQYQTLATPQNVTASGCTVSGALPGTLALNTYQYAQRRVDRICMSATGQVIAVRGQPDTWNPVAPQVPAGLLLLATITQRWLSTAGGRRLRLDGTTMLGMDTLADMRAAIESIRLRQAQQALGIDIAARYGGQQYGQFADPMSDDSMRDAGIVQTAAIADGYLQLPAGLDGQLISTDQITLARTPAPYLAQALQTGTLVIAAAATPAPVPVATLVPAVDRWTETIYYGNAALSPGGRAFKPLVVAGIENAGIEEATARARNTLLSMGYSATETIRQISVTVTITGMRASEQINAITVGGKPADISARSTTGTTATATFQIPAGIPPGAVAVACTGSLGTTATATFTGEVTTQVVATVQAGTHQGVSGALVITL